MRIIKLANGKGDVLVDDEDYEWLSRFSWHASTYNKSDIRYPQAVVGGYPVLMHNLIMPLYDGRMPDHRDRDGFNNQKSNLRPATKSQNMANKPPRKGQKYKGITYANNDKRWRAQISNEGKTKYISQHKTPEEAAMAYDREAFAIFGEFAYINFPKELEEWLKLSST